MMLCLFILSPVDISTLSPSIPAKQEGKTSKKKYGCVALHYKKTPVYPD